jgi:hypothetical protein
LPLRAVTSKAVREFNGGRLDMIPDFQMSYAFFA